MALNRYKKDLMMNNFIKHLSVKNTHNMALITSRFSSILLSTLQLTLMLSVMMITFPSIAIQAERVSDTADLVKIANTELRKSYSSSQRINSTSNTSQEHRLKANSQRRFRGESDQKKGKAINATRDVVMNQKHQQAQKIMSASVNTKMLATTSKHRDIKSINANSSRSFSDGNFAIYDAYSQLIEDYDVDGYFQTFSVTFDADLITTDAHGEAVVYAELYLRENGGPWVHYYSTDSFVIHGESSGDEFEVYTTLAQGFNTNHYDVLIDLYEEGYPSIIASYSSDDSNSLYALPLESSDYDVVYIEYYREEVIHGGSTSLFALLMVMLLLAFRQRPLRRNSPS